MGNIEIANKLRNEAGLTKTAAAELLYASYRQWRAWENNNSMPTGYLELFQIKINGIFLPLEVPTLGKIKGNKSKKAKKKIADQARRDILVAVCHRHKNKNKIAQRLHVGARTLRAWLRGAHAIAPAYLELILHFERERTVAWQQRIYPKQYS
jgi:DNA-binding transcriptional regulator YiaG